MKIPDEPAWGSGGGGRHPYGGTVCMSKERDRGWFLRGPQEVWRSKAGSAWEQWKGQRGVPVSCHPPNLLNTQQIHKTCIMLSALGFLMETSKERSFVP